MTAVEARSAARPPSVFLAIFAYGLRACLPAKRRVALLLPCAGAVLFGLLARGVASQERHGPHVFSNVAAEGILSLMMPIAALIAGDSLLGAEVRGGTFHFTYLTPVGVHQIVLGRWVAGALTMAVTIAPASALSAYVAGHGEAAWPVFAATAIGAAAYIALFLAIGCITRRTAVWSLAIVFLIERLLGAALTGIAQLSPTWESRAIFVGWLENKPLRLVREGIPEGSSAVVRLAIVTVVLLAVAIWRLRHLRLSGASD